HSGTNKKKRVYSSKYALSSIVVCPQCGDIYRRIAWNNRGKHSIVWRCCTRVEHGPKKCDADTILESDLQAAVVEAINTAISGKDEMLKTLEENIRLAFSLEDKDSLESINSKLEDLQQELLKVANAKQDYTDIANQIDHQRELKQKVLLDKAQNEGLKQRMDEMHQFLQEQVERIVEYDEVLVRRMVEKVTVYEDRLKVEFKSGTIVDVGR
ncbi:MAG: zinc ribbon domain-containing protein, partial [Treponemataceae bacterium]